MSPIFFKFFDISNSNIYEKRECENGGIVFKKKFNKIQSVLKEKKLWYSMPQYFNDPFDCNYSISMSDSEWLEILRKSFSLLDEKFKKLHPQLTPEEISTKSSSAMKARINPQDFLERITHNTTICSFVSTTEQEKKDFLKSNSISMWSHYAGNHQGFLIEFNNRHGNIVKNLEEISYSDNFSKINYHEFEAYIELLKGNDNKVVLKELWTKIYLRKHKTWHIENEWRDIRRYEKGVQSYGQEIPFISKDIKAIYLGCQIKHKDKEEIMNVLTENYETKPKLFEMSKIRGEYGLQQNEICY
uniref:DUF2971 domain-containing protein n=1 Tax=OCS116 cluster bacterium TaxID=2030921 RepID=A0A2A4Z203_9PROT